MLYFKKQSSNITNNEVLLLKKEIKKLQNQNLELNNQNVELKETLNWYQRQIFGKRSEKLVEDLNENQLIFEGFQIEKEEEKKIKIHTHIRKIKNKDKDKIIISPDLPVEQQIIDVSKEEKINKKTGKPLVKIGEEISHKLAYKPGSYFIKEIIRPKYALPNNDGILTAPMPESIIPKCKFDESLIADILVKKYADHLPLYRIREGLVRENIIISKQLLSKYVVRVGLNLKPLVDEMQKRVLQSNNVFIDESPIDILESPKCKQGYMWVITGGAVKNPFYRIYNFRLDRKHNNALKLLENYHGILHSDKYGAYENLANKKQFIWVPCWSHIRRKFFEAQTDPPFREWILRKIRYLFMLERVAWNRPENERLQIRQKKEIPIIDEIITKVKNKLYDERILPKSKLKKALLYLYSLIPYLKNYANYPLAHIDNNTAERAVRPLAIGRKNWLFVGSEDAGIAASVILSLVQTCRALNINPHTYLNDILRKIMSHSNQKLFELLPDQWLKNKR